MWQAGATLHRGEGATLHRGARSSHYRGLSLPSTGSRRAGPAIVAHGPSCSAACGIFPDQGLNPGPLHWQADSQPLRHQGSPAVIFNQNSSISFFFFFNLFIYFWLRCVFIAARRLSLVAVNGGCSSLRCVGFSLRWLLLLWNMGSRCMGFSSYGMWAQ